MISGRASEVQRNSVHVASFYESNDASIVEAYQPIELLSGAACGRCDPFFDPMLPWTHSIQYEPFYVSPFQACLNALSLQWEVGFDHLARLPQLPAIKSPYCASSPSTSILSQRPHSSDVHTKHVRFDDQIDIFLGDDEEIAMGKIQVAQIALHNWPTKPWSRKRIRKQNPYLTGFDTFPRFSEVMQPPEPSSCASLLSRDCKSLPVDESQSDTISFVQNLHFKQAIHSDHDVDLVETFGEGRTVPNVFTDHNDDDDRENWESELASSRSSSDSRIGPPSLDDTRQDVIMFHVVSCWGPTFACLS